MTEELKAIIDLSEANDLLRQWAQLLSDDGEVELVDYLDGARDRVCYVIDRLKERVRGVGDATADR